ncbi:TIGR03617 family F420-dependent LLM class oxidoreductase [Dactylosporangium sp. CA-092794]|uniref:TIGR03617 family F420-dependent LLM class oxidoreductase n=1 Tax=Dactylosporangium sp. CA-092794 TaxID=3239929 RepID=UPI003D92580D
MQLTQTPHNAAHGDPGRIPPASGPVVGLGFHASFDTLRATAAAVEEAGGNGFFVSEADHDAFVMLTAAAEHTRHVTLGTAVAIAFARTPMSLAYTAHDLQRLSGGRLVLGLGTQIAPHVVKRFGMPWSRPAARMKEYVAALHAIWGSWQAGTKLSFEGDFYTHTLMPQAFSPGPLDGPVPAIWLAGVGPKMVEVAAEVADGLFLHPMTSADYRDQVMLPSVDAGRAAARRSGPFAVAAMATVATGRTDEEIAASVALTKRQIAFYASTPAYLPVLAHHGWEELHHAANEGMRRGDYLTLGELVDDVVLETFAIVGDPRQVAERLRERYQPVDQVILTMPFQDAAAQAAALEILALCRH